MLPKQLHSFLFADEPDEVGTDADVETAEGEEDLEEEEEEEEEEE